MLEEVQSMVFTLFLTIVSGAVTIVGTYITLYIRKITNKLQAETDKITNEADKKLTQDALDRINDLVYQTVLATQVKVVEELKSSSADGKLTKEEAVTIANNVKEEVMTQVSQEILDYAKLQINDLDSYILNRIEVELTKVKKELN